MQLSRLVCKARALAKITGALSLAGFLSLAPLAVHAQSITVQAGSTFSVGDGSVQLNCGDLTVAGDFSIAAGSAQTIRHVSISSGGDITVGSGLISLSGDWSNAGAFTPGTGIVEIVDGCGTTSTAMSGDSTFTDFRVTTSTGRALQVASGSSQVFTDNLTLRGTPPNYLTIRSSSAGVPAFFTLNFGASQDIFGVDVADNDASAQQTIAPRPPADFSSINAGGNSNWFVFGPGGGVTPPGTGGQAAEAIDTLPRTATLFLMLLLFALASRFIIPPLTERSRP